MPDRNRIKRDQTLCVASIAIMVFCYSAERLLELFTSLSYRGTLIITLLFTVALVIVCCLISKSENTFYGLLAALIGYKMMPPAIPALANASVDGNMLYYIIQKISIVVFVFLAVKIYKAQKQPASIKALPVLACMFVVPFFWEIAENCGSYLMYQLGQSMLYMYFSQFAFYILASFVILFIAYQSNYASMRFVAYFEFVALGINILRKLGLIFALLIRQEHISKSNYVWIFVFLICIAAFVIAKNIKKREMTEE